MTPEQSFPSGTEARVCRQIRDRQKLGVAKYGTTVEDNPLSLREWLQHALEETLDQAIYLQRAIEELDRQEAQFGAPTQVVSLAGRSQHVATRVNVNPLLDEMPTPDRLAETVPSFPVGLCRSDESTRQDLLAR